MEKIILIVEDDQELNKSLCYALEKEGYLTVPAFSLQEAKLKFEELKVRQMPQLLIQDVNLPDGEGFTFCRWIKKQCEIPVLFLSARDLEEDALKGYDVGAEDYITKPFSMKILLRKISLILNRSQTEEKKIYDDGNLYIDWERARIMVGKAECMVTPTEFRLYLPN